MSDADFERERAQLFQKLGLRYDPESLSNNDSGLSTQQVKTALKRRTTAPPGVSTTVAPADNPAQPHTLPRKATAPGEIARSQVPTQPSVPAPDTSHPPPTTNASNSGHPAVDAAYLQGYGEREEKSPCPPETYRAGSPNRKQSSVTNVSNGTHTVHENTQGHPKEGIKPSLLSVPKVKSLKPPSSGVPSAAAPSVGVINKSVSATALVGSKRAAEKELARKTSLPEQSSLAERGEGQVDPTPALQSRLKLPSKPTSEVGTAKHEHTSQGSEKCLPEQSSLAECGEIQVDPAPALQSRLRLPSKPTPPEVGTAKHERTSQGSEKTPVRRSSMGTVQRPVQSSDLPNGTIPHPQPKLSMDMSVNPTNDPMRTSAARPTKSHGNLRISTGDMYQTPLATERVNFGNCTHCGLAVVEASNGCIAMEQLYHTSCFKCSQCGQGLDSKTFYVTSRGEIVCEKDYCSNLPKCVRCLQHIENRMVEVLGSSYHPGCFTCVVCDKEMEGLPFATDEDQQIYCEKDYHHQFSEKCFVCCNPFTPHLGKEKSMRVKAMGKYFHLECYKCEDCASELARVGSTEKKCYPIGDQLFCKECNSRRTGKEYTPLRDSTPSPVPHVKITPSPSPSPVPPWESGH